MAEIYFSLWAGAIDDVTTKFEISTIFRAPEAVVITKCPTTPIEPFVEL